MKICKSIVEVRTAVQKARTEGRNIGLVPTMGALHEGHGKLISSSASRGDFTIVSVFVNPTQFGPNEDLDAYPRTLEADAALAERCGAEVVFCPSVAEMYPSENPTWVEVTGDITKILCGASRPIHFRGVTTVVSKLFNIVKPDRAYFGQKDAQQVQVLKKMTRDLLFDVQLVVVPIVRESDGLAKSSRNVYLNEAQRAAAVVLHQSLQLALQSWQAGERHREAILKVVVEHLQSEPLACMEYAELRQLPDLQECEPVLDMGGYLLALAVRFGSCRLIDNIVLEA